MRPQTLVIAASALFSSSLAHAQQGEEQDGEIIVYGRTIERVSIVTS